MSDRWTIEQVLAANMLGALVGVFLGGMVFLGAPSVGRLAFLLFVAAIFTFAPYVLLSGRADRRAKEIERGARRRPRPDHDLRRGRPFVRGRPRPSRRVGRARCRASSRRLLQDIQIGIPRARAMENLLERT